jgi:colicin import membrane protein
LSVYRKQYFSVAMLVSLLGHCVLVCVFFFNLSSRFRRFPKRVVYSISLESGDLKGGISQVPKEKKKVPPPKKEVKKPEPEKVKKKEVKKKKIEKKDIALEEKKKKVPEKKPTPRPTAKPVPKKKIPPKKKPDVNKEYEEALKRYLGESTNAGGREFGSTGRGGRGMGGGVVRSPEWFLYKDQLETYVKRGWNWHDSSAELIAAVAFNISADGVISNISLTQSSGNRLYDDSVVRAVRKASPVPPAPPHLYRYFNYVEMDFQPE